MLLITLPIAILLGILIGQNIEVKNKTRKILTAFLTPLITGFVINSIAAGAKNTGLGFWFDYGQCFLFVAIPELALLITLLITLKVDKSSALGKDLVPFVLHYGSGEDQVEFVLDLTRQEIEKLEELREQDPERWEGNDYELVNEVKRQLAGKKESNASSIPEEKVVEDVPVEKQTLELRQNGIVVKMELPHEVLEQMESLRQQNPEQWNDNEVELVKAAKRKLQGVDDVNSEEKKADVVEPRAEEKAEAVAAPDAPKGAFGGKLESEYRRETKADAHWIRQDGTDICINIEDAVYQRMIEMQNENPKKWVNKELDLYQRAKKELMAGDTRKGLFRKK